MECPEGSTNGSVKYCVPNTDVCPLTAIHFKPKTSAAEIGFEYIDFDDTYQIGTSRKMSSLPITEFLASTAVPCISAISNPWTMP